MTDFSSTGDKSSGDENELQTAAEAESDSAKSDIEDSRQSEDSCDETEGLLGMHIILLMYQFLML